jgi:excisionase family DNA binding protein
MSTATGDRIKQVGVIDRQCDGYGLAGTSPVQGISQDGVSKMGAGRSPAVPAAQLLDVQAVAELLSCSSRHVYRLSDSGRMPPPIKLGALVRWSAAAIREWVNSGCKPVRNVR